MADVKITALTAISANPVNPATFPMPMVDLLDTSQAASGTTKKVTVNQILGSGGTATLASATITGAATVGTTLGVTGVSTLTGNVGVGVTPTNVAGHTRVEIKGSGSGNLTLRTASGNAAARDWQVACNLDTFGELNFRQGASTGAEPNSGTTRMVLTAAGDVSVSTGNVVMGTANKGIDFSINSDASATSELLNDYEEGTWTGTLTGGTTTPGSPLQATGKYTKIGRQVTVVIYFENINTTGYAGQVYVQGLPFTEDGSRAVGTAAFYNFDFNGGTGLFVDVSASNLFFSSQLTNAAWRDVNHSAGAGRYLRATVTYFV